MTRGIEHRLRAAFRDGAAVVDPAPTPSDPNHPAPTPSDPNRPAPSPSRWSAGGSTGRVAPGTAARAPSRHRVSPLLAAASIAVLAAGVSSAAVQLSGSRGPRAVAAGPAPTASTPLPAPTLAPGATARVGARYSFRWFVHCGMDFAQFAGKSWRVQRPAPAFPGFATGAGGGSADGYLSGTVTLLDAGTLRFVAAADQTAAPYAVTFVLITPTGTAPGVCA